MLNHSYILLQKPTKAQKRREQREAEEAEREARIAAEQASLGPDEREVEAAELNSLLQPLGLKVKDIPVGPSRFEAHDSQRYFA